MDKERRSPYTIDEERGRLEEERNRNNVIFHNKAAIAKEMGCSPTTIFRWLSGSLPKDPALMFEFCERYGVDMVYWTSGKRSAAIEAEALDVDRLTEAITTVDSFAVHTGESLSDAQKAKLISLMYTEEVGTKTIAKTLDVIGQK